MRISDWSSDVCSADVCSSDLITQLHAMVIGKMLDRDAFARWFGQYNSTPKYADMDWQPEEPIQIDELREALGDNVPLCRNPASRFSFIRQRANSVLLFVDGECFECVNETTIGRASCRA